MEACKNKTKCEGGDEIDLQGGKSGQHVKQSWGGCGAQQPKFSIDGLELLAVYKSQRKQYDEEQLPEPTERKQILTAEKECNVEEIEEEEPAPSKSSKDKKANGPEKSPSLAFKFTSKVPYKTVLIAHSSVVLKAETVADKVEWIKKISKVIQPSKGVPRGAPAEGGPTMRQSLSDGSLDTMTRRPADPEEELWGDKDEEQRLADVTHEDAERSKRFDEKVGSVTRNRGTMAGTSKAGGDNSKDEAPTSSTFLTGHRRKECDLKLPEEQ
ncbi:hypothetical protein ACLB2K_035551 [Fragaria x ananassa]